MMVSIIAEVKAQVFGVWVFGGAGFVVILIYLLWGPRNIPAWKEKVLGILLALTAGMFGYFMFGNLTVELEGAKKNMIQAGGGFGLFVLVLLVMFREQIPFIGAFSRKTKVKRGYHFEGKENVREQSKGIMGRAERAIRIFGGDVSWIDDHSEILREKFATHVSVRMLYMQGPSSQENVEKARGLNIDAQPYPEIFTPTYLTGQIIDGNWLFSIVKRPSCTV